MKKKLLSIMALFFAIMGTSNMMAQTDVTFKINNPSFEVDNGPSSGADRIAIPTGWNLEFQVEGWKDGFVTGKNVGVDGGQAYNFWAATITSFDLYQSLTEMPKGKYTLSAYLKTDNIKNQHFYATVDGVTSKSAVTSGSGQLEKLSVEFNVANDNSTIRIGATGNGWCIIDDFTLSYVEVNLDDFIASYNIEKENLENMKTGATQGTQAFIDEVIAGVANPEETENWYNQAIAKLQDAQKTVTELKAAYADFELKYVSFETFLNASEQHTDASAKDTYSQCIATAKVDADAAKDVSTFSTIMTALENGRLEYSKVAIANDGETLDYTFYIINPNGASQGEGWTVNGPIEYLANEHWSGSGTYFNPANWGANSWETALSQTIVLPNGTYTLKAAGRAEVDSKLSFTAGDQEHVFPSTSSYGGTIATDGTEWANIAEGLANGKTFARNNEGFGWTFGYIKNILVTNEELTIGIKASSNTIHNWTSIGDFQLFKQGKALEEVVLNVSEAGWATLMLPFDADIQDGMEVYSCSAVSESVLTLEPVVGQLVANTPYIVKAEAGMTFTFSGYSVAEENIYTSGLLTGVYAETLAPVGSYVLQNQTDGVAFYKVEDGAQPAVKANRAYLMPDAAGVNVRAIYFPNGDATGVESVDAADVMVDVYTMSGIRVRSNVKKSDALNGLKGVYILKAVK